ncbi:hypothetical protein A1sIIB106_02200 [Candidatus Planktophila lacus]|uniref:hypothetical protein n=1 Tax=Candidatus Planktophila lacus TaxID=1884913 RepID=UPI000BACB949|nr:hypothetical protein [Candidatus Planktophila lacus]ASY24859.1 hypothetical protein A1sIIB106_02200 [Candidatus Planktophila lacus]
MKSVRKYGAALVAALLLGSLVQANTANAGMKFAPDIPLLGLLIEDGLEFGRSPNVVFGKGNLDSQETWLRCDDLEDKICTDAAGIIGYVNLTVCTDASSVACIADVWAVDSAGKKIPGKLVKSVPLDYGKFTFKENVAINLPDGTGQGALWQIPGVINSAGKDTYFVSSQFMLAQPEKKAGEPISARKIFLSELKTGISPVEEIPGQYRLIQPRDNGTARASWVNWGDTGNWYLPDGSRCVGTDVNVCEAVREFPAGYRFGVSLRMGTKLSGWYHGRLALPDVTIKNWKTGQEISVEAEPVRVPTLNFSVPNAEIPQKVRDIVFTDRYFGKSGDGIREARINDGSSSAVMVDLAAAFAPAYKDKATSTNTTWAFKAMNYGQNSSDVQKCSDNTGNVAGLVTTNALTYLPGPPTFDKESQSLTYKVASPHYEANGSLASGSYDLSMRSDIARCLYGFSSAPIKAEISITSDEGEKKVATTIVNEKNGWLYLSAKGFTFSAPTINVKLSQEKVVAPVASKKITISCVKGKTTKKVTAVSPKCPAGYKKK